MRGSVRTAFKKVKRIHGLDFSYDYFMLSLCYRLCELYTDYASTDKHYSVALWFSVYLITPQRSKRIHAILWEVQFGQHFRRYRKFTSLNFRMLLLCYRYVIVYANFIQIMILQRSLQIICVTLILCFYVYSWSDAVMVHSIYYASMRKHCYITDIISHGHLFSTDSLLCWISANIRICYSKLTTDKDV